MARTLSKLSKDILNSLENQPSLTLENFYSRFSADFEKKEIYNTLFRLISQELLQTTSNGKNKTFSLSADGKKAMFKHNPKRDGVWKIIIFDIPESKRAVRNFIRAKLKNLGFKKWQNSIWVSPYALDRDLEKELETLATKLFIRLIKTTDINYTKDLDKLFD
jgi:CRISPR-associated endonuclease Cas2